MAWANPSAPNLPDFTLFVANNMGIATAVLPTDSPFIGYAFNRALALAINVCGGIDYTLAVYNCAGHILVKTAPDQNGRADLATLREKLGLAKFAAGVVAATSDQSTATTLAVPEALSQLTIGDLDFLRTPWGRDYLAHAQDFGPSVWGLS